MTPAARIQAAIEVLDALEGEAKPADRFLRDWFRARRYAGAKDRAAVGERVFAVLRHHASLAWRMDGDDARHLVMASLEGAGSGFAEIEALFSGERHAPAKLDEGERLALSTPKKGTPPAHVRGEFPLWLEAELRRAYGDDVVAECAAFVERAPVDLRVNTLKTTRNNVLARVKSEGLEAAATPFAPCGIRLAQGAKAAGLDRGPLYREGLIEFQDEGAQLAASLCLAGPGMQVLDLAAGAGGKSLALAADMQNAGEIVACDIRTSALNELAARARRAGASIVRASPGAPPERAFDMVLVDAPCSGSGTWRRQPELKWRLTGARLAELTKTQDVLLAAGSSRVGKSGRLVYATCSILPCENEDRVKHFLAQANGFRLMPAGPLMETICPELGRKTGDYLKLSPLSAGTDGFFAAVFERAS